MNNMSGKKVLVVAEKPSVAREIAAVVGAGRKRDGYLESQVVAVTHALGHLVGIAEPEVQNPAWGKPWRLEQLPMLPSKFQGTVLEKSRKQFEIVKQLMTDPAFTEVVNACDAGREGELIFRRIYLMAGCTLPIKRLWASDMTENGLKKALADLMPGEVKRNLGLAAFARSEADWAVGMNFSRLFSIKARDFLSLGRVQTPVLALLVDRRREIENFTPREYWEVEAEIQAQAGKFFGVWHMPPEFKETQIACTEDAEAIRNKCLGRVGRILGVESRIGTLKPPLPFDLTNLQKTCNVRFGMSAKETLDLAQILYEKHKAITYPRTDSQHLTEEIFAEILEHMRAVYHHFPDIATQAAARVQAGEKFAAVDSKKVTDHHAIIPTARKVRRDELFGNEWKVYEVVCRRFLAAFLPQAEFLSTVIWTECAAERFKSMGKMYKSKGWLEAEPSRDAEDKLLPTVRQGEEVILPQVETAKKQTKPPHQHTDASLLSLMETAGKLVEDEELAAALKARGLGTPATRAQTIETLIARKYVDKQKKALVATDKGCQLVDLARTLLPGITSAEMTGEWERKLRRIESGEMTYPQFMDEIRAYVASSVEAMRGREVAYVRLPVKPAKVVGVCPLCGGSVIETSKGYGCSNWKAKGCKFTIWKETYGGKVGKTAAKELLQEGRTKKELKLKSKDGREYYAHLKLEENRVLVDFSHQPRRGPRSRGGLSATSNA